MKNCFKIGFVIYLFCLFTFSCSSVRLVKPIEKGEKQISTDLGGPLVIFSDIPIFLPLTSIGGAYGITDNLSLQSSLHTTSLLFGTLHIDMFANTNLIKFNNSGLTINAGGYYFFGFREKISSAYPIIDLNYYFNYSSKPHYLYSTFSSMFELHKTKAYKEPIEQRLIPTFSVGHRWQNEKTEWGIELKYLSFLKDNRNIVVQYIAPFNKGSLGLYFSFFKKF